MYLLSRMGRLVAVGLSALSLTACATMHVNSYVQGGIDLTQYRTYTWGPADTSSTGDPRIDNNLFFDERVRSDVEAQLAEKGFEKTRSSTPDLLVHYHASFTQQIYGSEIDRQYGYCNDENCWPEVYEAGTLLIDLVDAGTNRLVWRGWAKGTIDGVIDNQEWMEEKIDATVTRILERLPRKL